MQNLPFAAQQDQVNKFLASNRALGANMDQMQGTTRIVYDTQDMTGITSYSFFSQLGGKQAPASFVANSPATNLTDNRFDPGEGMVVKELFVYNLETTAANVCPIAARYISLATVDILIGNNRVVKSLPLFAGSGFTTINNLNPQNNANYSAIRLLTNIVIPPQIQFFVNITLPAAPSAAATKDAIFRVALRGYGKLFNPRNNY
jgi:hypothetical protein